MVIVGTISARRSMDKGRVSLAVATIMTPNGMQWLTLDGLLTALRLFMGMFRHFLLHAVGQIHFHAIPPKSQEVDEYVWSWQL
jgi:hypothetical protein